MHVNILHSILSRKYFGKNVLHGKKIRELISWKVQNQFLQKRAFS